MVELLHFPTRNPISKSSGTDDSLIARIRAKAEALAQGKSLALIVPFPSNEQRPGPGLGELFEGSVPDVSEEEMDTRTERSLNENGDVKWDDMTVQMLRESCAFFAQEILTGPAEEPYCGKFLLGNHHVEWDNLVAKYKRLCILASRDHGKCEIYQAPILRSDGLRVPIGEWRGGEVLAYDELTGKFVATYAPAARRNGVRSCLTITTKSGRQETVTLNHPLLTWGGWVAVENLQIGQRIAVPRCYHIDSVGKDYADAWLLGVLIGDGHFGVKATYLCKSAGPVTKQAKQEIKKHAPWEWVAALGLSGCTAHKKFVPDVIFTSSQKSIAEFIAGYLDTDAHISFSREGLVEFYSVSERLLRDMQHLLLRIGVLSNLSKKRGRYKGNVHFSWRLSISGFHIVRLAEVVHPRGKRKKELFDVARLQKKRNSSSGHCLDLFPNKLRKIAEAENNQELFHAVNSDVFWDEIMSIEDAGEQETFGLEVPTCHNYVSNDIVNHNTFFFDFAYPIWQAFKGPGVGFIFSATQPQAERILEDIKSEIMANPRLQWLVPAKKDKWSSTSIRLSNGHRIYARGFGTKVRGAHPHWIVVDDGLNDETAYSELTRRKQIDYFYNAISNMLRPDGQMVVIGCVTLDTWVATHDGLQRIGSLCPGALRPGALYPLHTLVMGRRGVQETRYFWVQGETDIKRVELEFGFRLCGSHRHPFLVMGEDGIPCWRRADNLKRGDFVAVQEGMDSWGTDIVLHNPIWEKHHNRMRMPLHLTEDLAYLIGLWTAEGSYEQTGRVNISNTEPEIRAWLATSPFGMQFKVNTAKGSEQTLRCSSKSFLELITRLGGILGTAEKKVVPEKIMSASKSVVRSFLQGLFDGDGCASKQPSQICYATVSEALARDVQLLLLNFGILASLRKRLPAKPTKKAVNGGKFSLWVVVMTGLDARLFMERVGFRLSRKQEIAKFSENCDSSKMRGIPLQAGLIQQARQEKPRRNRSSSLMRPPLNISNVAQCERSSRKLLQETVAWFERYGSQGNGVAQIQKNLDEQHLVWLKVKDIQDDKAFTVDFVLGGDNSFVGNGIVCHNTPFHAEDLYSDLAKNPAYKAKNYPAIQEDGSALWPERYSKKRLEAKKAEIGALRFAREFMCEPIFDEASLFPGYLFKGAPTEQPTVKLGMPLEFWEKMGVQIFIGADFAMSSSVQADYTVVFVLGLDKFGNRWIVDIHRARGLPYQEQLSLINTLGKKYQASLIYLEANQMQRIFGDELIRTTDLPIKKFVTGVQKNSLDKGVPSLRILLENKKYRIPRGDAYSIEMTDAWINEMRSFTWLDGKLQGVGAHDDLVMGNWIADQAVRQGAFGFTFGDEDDMKGNLEETLAEQTQDDTLTPENKKKIGVITGTASGDLVDPDISSGLPPSLGFGYDWES